MITFSTRRAVSLLFIGVFLSPALKYLDDEKRTHARHAACEHHLRHHHPDPVERAKIVKRAARQERRQQERARAEEARRALLAALEDGDPQAVLSAADLFDDDHQLKKGRRKRVSVRNDCSLEDPPQIRPAGDFLAMLRTHLDSRGSRLREPAAPLPHFGSGPCHSIPRPRESTIERTLPNAGVLA